MEVEVVKAIVAQYRKAAADGLTQAEAATRLGKSKSTVSRVAAKNNITFAAGVLGRIPDYTVIQIGPNIYPSVKVAAATEVMAFSSIYAHLRNGTPERIGSRRRAKCPPADRAAQCDATEGVTTQCVM